MFEDYKTKARPLRYLTIFFLRRYCILLVLTVYPANTLTQILTHMVSTMYVIGFVAGDRPFRLPSMNNQELLNEMTVLIAAYPLLIFTNWVPDEERKLDAGWFVVACIGLNVLINMSVLIAEVCKAAFNKIKLYMLRYQYRKDLAKRIEKKRQEVIDKKNKADFIYSMFYRPGDVPGHGIDKPILNSEAK